MVAASPLFVLLLASDLTAAFVSRHGGLGDASSTTARVSLQPQPSQQQLKGIGSRTARVAATDPLREWVLSEIGSLDVPNEERATPDRTDGRFLDSPASDPFSSMAARPATRRDWLGATSAAAAAVVTSASAWSYRTGSAAAAGAMLEAPVTTELPKVSTAASLCDPSITTFRNPTTGRIVHILGTAHISTDSAQLAGRVVREVKPDAVFVELDRKRIARALPQGDEAPSGGPGAGERISVGLAARGAADGSGEGALSTATAVDNNQAENPPQQSRRNAFGNPIQRAKESAMEASTKAVGNAIKGMYSKLGDQGFNPGEEFILAIREAMAINAAVVLGDRDVDVTLRRLTEALAKTDLKKLLSSDSELEQALENVMPDDMKRAMDGDATKMTKDQLTSYVETVKARENVRFIMSQLKLYAPELHQAMVAERDEYMARGLDSLDKFGTTVAVMGIAHVDGVEGSLKERGWEQVSIPCLAK